MEDSMENKLTMYCVTHKSLKKYAKGRTPIFVGNGKNEQNYLTDNTGDNISAKNKNYCELTALYWIWKNDKSSQYVSIEHYRRFFFNPKALSPISKDKVEGYLKDYDLIETRPYIFKPSVRDFYSKHHYGSDLDVVQEAVKLLYPQYLDSFAKIMNGNQTSMCNMIVMSKKNFDSYCQWLFDILGYVENHIDITERDDYQKRVYGFLSERLQNVWVDHQNLKVKKLPIYFVENSKFNSLYISLRSVK